MRKSTVSTLLVSVAVWGSSSTAAVVDNFESYALNSSLADNGWTQYGGGGSYILETAVYAPQMEGSQLAYVSGQFDLRDWGAASSEIGNLTNLSYQMKQEVAASVGQTWFFLSDNVANGSTPAGILLDHATSTVRLSGATETPTAFVYSHGTVYQFEMELNFLTDTFNAYVTDLTNGGVRTLLGVQAFSNLDASTVAVDGGIGLGNFSGGSAAFWDNIQVTAVPEPASLTLVGLGVLAASGRRRR